MRDIIIFKELMEREEYENISLVAKIAYDIYVSMLEDYENVKKDENGVRYITDGRKTLEEILKISPVTMTKIHKELVDAELIVEKHQGVSKPLATYINNYETLELEKTQENDEMKEIGELLKNEKMEFSDSDIQDSKELINESIGRFPYIIVSNILKDLDMSLYSERDQKMIKLSIAYMDIYYFKEDEDYSEIIEYIDEDILDEVLDRNRKTHPVETKASIIAKEIFELAKEKYTIDNN